MPSHVSDQLRENVEDFVQWIRVYKAANAGFPQSAALILQRCEDVCVELLKGNEAIPVLLLTQPRMNQQDKVDYTEELRKRESNRRAVEQAMVVKALSRPGSKPVSMKDRVFIQLLINRFSVIYEQDGLNHAEQNVPAGPIPATAVLMPDHQHGGGVGIGGFRASSHAKDFFERKIRGVLQRLDDVYQSADFSSLAPDLYDGTDPNNVVKWGQAWTRASAAVAMNWLDHEGDHTFQGIIGILLGGRLASLVPKKRGMAALPSNDHYLRLELWVRPLLCQVFHHNENIGNNAIEVVYAYPRYLKSQPSNGESFASARATLDIYLIALIETLDSIFAAPPTTTPAMITAPTFALPSTLVDNISPGQAPTVCALINRQNLQGGAGAYFAPTPQIEASSEYQVFALPSRLVKATAAPDDRLELIGSVTLDATKISSDHDQWLSLALIVRYQKNWYSVAIEVEEDDDEKSDVLWLSIDPNLAVLWPMDALRTSFVNAKWVYRLAGLGVFVAGSVDLDD